ncbi:MAG TPA: AAA family ATPase [Terriglobales bacterium]|nr:AAA family ATPase [Terriglobales bacterium]
MAGQTDDCLSRLKILFNSTTPVVIIETLEEERLMFLVRSACSELDLPLFEWSIATGLVRSGSNAPVQAPTGQRTTQTDVAKRIAAAQAALVQANLPPVDFGSIAADPPSSQGAPIVNTATASGVLAHLDTMTIPSVFVLKDFHRQMDDAIVVRRLREVAQDFAHQRRTMILTGPSVTVPPELSNLVEYVDLALPDRERLRQIIQETYRRLAGMYTLKSALDEEGWNAVASNLRGLTEEEAERAVAQVIVKNYGLMPPCVTEVLEAKKEILRRTGMLEFVDVTSSMASVGGLENLKKWLQKRAGAFADDARSFGLEPPRGLIIMGVQGCGKSLCARSIAGEWKLPLVRFDSAAVFDKYIGETEKRIKKLFDVAEELSPCVLWIDELEKVFAGSAPDSASVDAGVSSRLLGSFLSWMQDRKSPVFVAATSNNVNALPPELIRKGRFDEIFFVDLPNSAERRAIFGLQLARRKRNPADFDLDRLAGASADYSGAEIDAVVQSAMYASFSEHKPMSTQSLLEELKNTVPLSATRAEDIAELRDWARERAVPASLPEGVHPDRLPA